MIKRKMVYRDPRKLVVNKRNAKKHPPEQVVAIRASMDRFGNNNPILLKDDDKTIGAGHGRQLAALLDPPLESVPTITLTGLTDEEWRLFVIADNKLAEGATWDENVLKLELGELRSLGLDLSLTGFGVLELGNLLPPPKDAVPPTNFPVFGDQIETTYCCPKCAFRWSGKAAAES